MKKYIFLFIILWIYGCNDNTTNSLIEKPDINIDSSYSIAIGGDPRGNYKPNTPFVFYFGSEYSSFSQNSGEGWLKIEGTTKTNGMISYELNTKVGGTVGDYIYAVVPATDNQSGTWKIENNNFIITINSVSDTIPFSVKNQALYLIYKGFKSKPFDLIDPGFGALGSTIWVFK